MKLSYFVPTFLIAGNVPGTGAITNRNLHEKVTDLSNGAVLGVDISEPVLGTSYLLMENETSRGVSVTGEAHVGKGVQDVAYIYVIDSSLSTDEYDGDCGTTLDCVQAFFEALHAEVVSDGSAEVVAVIDFDDEAHVTADFQDPSNFEILDAVRQGSSGGDTACSLALEMAALVALDPKNTAGTTVVVFAGDGECTDGGVLSQGENVTVSADILGATGAIVHSIAVGDNVDCDPGNDLENIPRNGGKCFSIPEPNALPGIIDDLIGTNLTSLEVKVDGGDYEDLVFNETSKQLPQDGAVSVDFHTSVSGLAEGSHEICVRATGNDSIGGHSQVEDCHNVLIETWPVPQETEDPFKETTQSGVDSSDRAEGWMIFLVVAGCVGVLALAIFFLTGRGASSGAAGHDVAVARPPSIV